MLLAAHHFVMIPMKRLSIILIVVLILDPINLYATYSLLVDTKPYDIDILTGSTNPILRVTIIDGDTSYKYQPSKLDTVIIDYEKDIINLQHINRSKDDLLPSFNLESKGNKGTFLFKGKIVEASTDWVRG